MRRLSISVATLAGVTVASSLALGQAKPDCTPHKDEGRVEKVDMDHGTLTLQEANGKTFDFQAPKDVLHDKKVGDRLEVTKRLPDGCK
jgi:hypothetical protein